MKILGSDDIDEDVRKPHIPSDKYIFNQGNKDDSIATNINHTKREYRKTYLIFYIITVALGSFIWGIIYILLTL